MLQTLSLPQHLNELERECLARVLKGSLCGKILWIGKGWQVFPTVELRVDGQLISDLVALPSDIDKRAKSAVANDAFVEFQLIEPNIITKKPHDKRRSVRIIRVLDEPSAQELTEGILRKLAEPLMQEVREHHQAVLDLKKQAEEDRNIASEILLEVKAEGERMALRELDLEKRDSALQSRESQISGWRLLLGDIIDGPPLQTKPERLHGLSSETIEEFVSHLDQAGYRVDQDLGKRFLVATLVAATQGRFVLLNGPVGTGKTSLVRAAASCLGPRSATVVPVRPGWLDPSDLFGYLNPIDGKFVLTPFTAALQAIGDPTTLAFVCLDEMNIARIENYAADLLACLEYSDGGCREVKLFSAPDAARDRLGGFRDHARSLAEGRAPHLTDSEREELDRVRATFLQPDTLRIGENVVFYGTLNSDESTYQITPKMVDRSLVVQFPRLDVQNIDLESARVMDKPCLESYIDVGSLRAEIHQMYGKAKTALKEMSDDRLLPPNEACVAMGHRAVQDLASTLLVCEKLGIPQESKAHFLATKVLPRVYLPNKSLDNAATRLRTFLERARQADPASNQTIRGLEAQLDDPNCASVSYWHTP